MHVGFRTVVGAFAAALAFPAGAAIHPVTGERLAEDQTFTYSSGKIISVDPQLAQDVTSAEVIRDLFEGLMNQDADGNLEPGVALGYQLGEGRDVYTFSLRPDARWSNGDPVTARDFVYAWQRAVDPALDSPYSWFMELMSIENAHEIIAGEQPASMLGVAAIDDHTLEVRLTAPLPHFPQMTVHTTTFPVHRATVEAHGDDWTRPGEIVSNGAYVLTEHRPEELSVRERNPMYWNDDRTIIGRVVAVVIDDSNVALERFLSGELDMSDIPAGQFPRLKQEHPDEAFSIPRLCSYYYSFNLGPSGAEELRDARVRRALSLAIDRKSITSGILAGEGQIEAYSFTPAAIAGFEPPQAAAASMSQPGRDALAARLMGQAGFGPDNPLRLEAVYNTNESNRSIAEAIGRMWKRKLGVEVAFTSLEWSAYLDPDNVRDFDLVRSAWCGDYNEASTFLNLFSSDDAGYSTGNYVNARIDDLLARAKTATDPRPHYEEVERIVGQEVPVIPIYHAASVFMLDDDVRNWPVGNVEQNWYSRTLFKVAVE